MMELTFQPLPLQVSLFSRLDRMSLGVWEALELLDGMREYETALLGDEGTDPGTPFHLSQHLGFAVICSKHAYVQCHGCQIALLACVEQRIMCGFRDMSELVVVVTGYHRFNVRQYQTMSIIICVEIYIYIYI